MNLDLENIIQTSAGQNGKAFNKVIGDLKKTFAMKNASENNRKEPLNNAGRVKLGVLANSNIVSNTPMSKAAQRDEKELLKQCSGDDFDNFIKSTTVNQPLKPAVMVHYPPVEYGYVTKTTDFDDDVLYREPESGIVWERDEEDLFHESSDISDTELDAFIDAL